MKASIKQYLPLAAIAAGVWAMRKNNGVSGIGKTRQEFEIAKVVRTEYRNSSTYGNPSYHVWLVTPLGYHFEAYTAPNSSLGYSIENPEYKNDWHVFFYTSGKRGIALHEATKYH